jgi:isocitrate dehydrogenase
VSLEDLGIKEGNPRQAAGQDPGRRHRQAAGQQQVAVAEDRRARQPRRQFYLAMYWAQELAAQTEDQELAAHFAKLAKTLTDNEAQIVAELKTVQGQPVDIGGYYKADSEDQGVMRPSPTLNAALKAARV